jgi:hypothetical protein
MNDLINILKSFNRKERFYLIGKALGNKDFILSDEFRLEVGEKLNLTIPPNAFCAMDYHIDWIYASLKMYQSNKSMFPKDDNIKATQEDVDLIIAFNEDNITHIILIEAKGDTPWDNNQLGRKSIRLEKIFGYVGDKWNGVVPHFLITSPVQSKKLKISNLPKWMLKNGKPIWLPLEMPANLVKVTRCDGDKQPSVNGDYWKID